MMAILSKVHIPDGLESHESIGFSFTSILLIRSNFVGCRSFLEFNFSWYYETNLEDSIK